MCWLIIQQATFAGPMIWGAKTIKRPDGAIMYKTPLNGSYEDPTWFGSEDEIIFAVTKGEYGNDYSNLYLLDVKTGETAAMTNERNMRLTSGDHLKLSDEGFLYVEESENASTLKGITIEENRYKRNFIQTEADSIYEGDQVWNPSISYDEKWLAYDAATEEVLHDGTIVHQIYRRDLNTGEEIAITSGPDHKRRPRWSPNNYVLLYEQYDAQFREWSLYVSDYNGNVHRRLTKGLGDEIYGSFSPDGNWVVYTSNESLDGRKLDRNRLYICAFAGREAYPLTKSKFYDSKPVWSPDGYRIVFETSAKDPVSYGKTQIAVIDIPEEIELLGTK